MSSPRQFHVIPQINGNFLIAEYDAKTNAYVNPGVTTETSKLNLAGMYKLLFVLNRISSEKFGSAYAAFQKLPNIDVNQGTKMPETFQKEFETVAQQESLRKKLQSFLKAYYKETLERRNTGNVTLPNPTRWDNLASVVPTQPVQLIKTGTGFQVESYTDRENKKNELQALIDEVNKLSEQIKLCRDTSCLNEKASAIQTKMKEINNL